MSRSNPTSNVNPVSRRFQWKGKEGFFKYYNKDNKTNIDVPLPFRFLPLDARSGVTGWSDTNESAIWSNHVKDITTDELIIKVKSGTVLTGKWNNIKDKIKAMGGKFAAFVYVAFINNDSYEIGTVEIKGASLSAWFNFCKHHDINRIAVEVSESRQEKNGAVTYEIPVFKAIPVSEEANTIAIDLDKQLQEYLGKAPVEKELPEDETPEPIPGPFEMTDTEKEDPNDLPF